MEMTLHYWNGNKYGRNFQYPLNEPVPSESPGKLADDYLGHNIAALIVDGNGLVIDFEFNHNEIMNSSVEHAESRLLRRVFGLAQIQDSWQLGTKFGDSRYGMLLRDASLYTTLESCAQCSGIMALALLKEVIFLQSDPGQYSIGNIMRNMTVGTDSQAPEPISADALGFPFFEKLNAAYECFAARPETVENAMILTRDGKLTSGSATKSITSFLCTKAARDIYVDAAAAFARLDLQYPDWKPGPPDSPNLTNAKALEEVRQFVQYATIQGRRGTPHRV